MKYSFYQLRTIGPRILAKKAIKRLVDNFKANNHQANHCSYLTEYSPFGKPNTRVWDFQEILPLVDYGKISKEYVQNVLDHKFDVLSSGLTDWNLRGVADISSALINESNRNRSERIASLIQGKYRRLDYRADRKSGFVWDSRVFHKNVKYSAGEGYDIKIPWEFGRLQHLTEIAVYAYFNRNLLHDIKNEVRNQILDFAASNPPGYGVQWKTTMDAAIRCVSIIAAYSIIKATGEIYDEEFESVLFATIKEHIEFVKENLEFSSGMRGNHYLFNVMGLLAGSLFLPGEEKNVIFAIDELAKETLYQFNPDGSNFEASTNYHAFTYSGILWSLLAIESASNDQTSRLSEFISSNQKRFEIVNSKVVYNKEVYDRVKRGLLFIGSITRSDGSIPAIGDNDSGVFLKVFPDCDQDKRFIFSLYGALSGDFSLHGLICGNKNPIKLPQKRPIKRKEYSINTKGLDKIMNDSIVSFPDFGLYSFRTEKYHATFRCGDVGQKGRGGHSHNDQLSITLFVSGEEIITDPGMAYYTSHPEIRNYMRSSVSHSCPLIKDLEQNPFDNKTDEDLFWIKENRTKAGIKLLSERTIKGVHHAYGFDCSRELVFDGASIEITDALSKERNFEASFILAPGTDVDVKNPGSLIILNRNNVKVGLQIFDASIKILETAYSESYGSYRLTRKVIVKNKTNLARLKISIL